MCDSQCCVPVLFVLLLTNLSSSDFFFLLKIINFIFRRKRGKGRSLEKDFLPEKSQQEKAKEGLHSDNDTLASLSRYAILI